MNDQAQENSPPLLGDAERMQLRGYSIRGGENFKDVWPLYKFEMLSRPPTEQVLLELLMEQGETHGVYPFRNISRAYINTHQQQLLAITESQPYMAALVCLFQEQVHERFADADSYLQGLEQQGGSTVASALATAPPGWLPEHTAALLDVRRTFGVLAHKIFYSLALHCPNGPNEISAALIQTMGIPGLALLRQHGINAPLIARQHRPLLTLLEQTLNDCDRSDSFLAALLTIREELLTTQGHHLVALAKVQPYYFPRLVKYLTALHLESMPELVYEIARSAKSGSDEAIQSLSLLKKTEHHFAGRLIFHSGIHTDSALAMRGPVLLEQNPARHHALLTEYGHSFWGLSEQFKNELHEKEQEYRNFILEARSLTGQGAGMFFSQLPRAYWNEQGIAFARRYGEAAGYILKQRGVYNFSIESSARFSELSIASQTEAGITWINRYSKMHLGHLDTSLLRTNIENYRGERLLKGPLSVSLLPIADPKNSFGDSIFFELLSNLSARTSLFLGEVATIESIDNQLAQICEAPQRGGSATKPLQIDQLILGAHCNGHAMQLSGVRHCPPATMDEATLRTDQSITIEDETRIAQWRKYLAPGSTIVLVACSALKPIESPPSIGSVFQRVFPESTVLGLRDIGNLEHFELSDEGKIDRLFWKEGHTWI